VCVGNAGGSPAHIEVERVPATLSKRLPGYPLPVLRLARLATDRRVRGQGVGLELLSANSISMAPGVRETLECA
jgi:hypothetical protein